MLVVLAHSKVLIMHPFKKLKRGNIIHPSGKSMIF
jgi:hypothetical protein